MSLMPVPANGGILDGAVTNAKLADMAEATIKGRAASAGTGDPQDLSAEQARTALGLVIGTNVQAQDAELQAIAGLTSAADKIPYFTGSGTASLTDITAAGRAILDDTNAAAQRATLDVPGLNTANTLTGTQTFQAAATQDAIKVAGRAGGTSSYAVTIIPLALSANRTLSAPDADGTIATLSAQTFTGAQRFPTGTAAAPSILLDDTDTGFYRAGTNQIGISCAGKTLATITSANWLHYGFGIELPIDTVRANGTETAPTKVLSGESLGRYGFRSYYDDGVGGAGYSIVGCAIRSIATEDHNSNTNLGQQLEIRTVTNGAGSATTRAIVFPQGTLGVGLVSGAGATYISPASIANNAPKLQSLGTSSAGDSAYLQARFDATAGDCPQHVLAKSRGTTLADYTAVASGDTLGIIAGEGADGTEFIRAGSIRCVVDGTVSTGVVPGRWDFYTNNASGTGTLALRITSSQNAALTGRLTQQGCFAEIHLDNGSTAQSIATGTEYTKLTGIVSNGEAVNATADGTNSKITVTKTGRYRVSFSMSFSSGTNNATHKFAIFWNGTEQHQVHAQTKLTTGADSQSVSGTGIVRVTSANTDIDLRARHDQGGSVNVTPIYANITIDYLGE